MTSKAKPALILASSSPQRRALLAEAAVRFEAFDPPVCEPDHPWAHLTPRQTAEALAYLKARAVSAVRPEACVLAADTVVAVGADLLGKPDGPDDARRMLGRLSGTRHRVITGVALLLPGGGRKIASAVTWVTMRKMTPAQIDDYIASGEWIGKAGSYAIQLTADRYVERIEGSFSNVVGLPMELVQRMLRDYR